MESLLFTFRSFSAYLAIKSTSKLTFSPIVKNFKHVFDHIFHYPKGDIISGELHVPVGREVSLKMESKDVIHAFWVPQFILMK